MVDLFTCLCSVCTDQGRRPSGSKQSRPVRAQHIRADKARSAAGISEAEGPVSTVEETILLAALSLKDDDNSEDPLWRGWRGPAEFVDAGMYEKDEEVTEIVPIENSVESVMRHLRQRQSAFLPPQYLHFSFPPTSPTCAYPGPGHWDTGPTALKETVLSNAPIMLYQKFLVETRNVLKTMVTGGEGLEEVQRLLEKLETIRKDDWQRQQRATPDPENLRSSAELLGAERFNTDIYYQPLRAESPIIILGLFLVLALNLFHHLVRSGCRLALHILKGFMELSFQEISGPNIPANAAALVNRFPVDLQSARKYFDLEPVLTRYVCCPDCFALYPAHTHMSGTESGQKPLLNTQSETLAPWASELPYFDIDTPHAATKTPFPMRCHFRATLESSPCGARLANCDSGFDNDGIFRMDVTPPKPLKIYSHQSLRAWLSRLISRPGIETLLDETWVRVREPIGDLSMSDIWDATEIRDFVGPDGKPFHCNPNKEGRYLFGLFIDWFNPLGNKQAGKAISSGVIFMVCLNLPLRLRYKRENVYLVGIMPGPKAPRLQQVNHFLDILVQELLGFWSPGVFFSRTTLFPAGRVMRCALIPLICDLGAIKKAAGQASHSATFFCSFCKLKKTDINNLNPSQWPERNCEEHRTQANEWRDAPNEKAQKKAFKRAGVRYTPLLKLPYWKPTRYVVIEAMHNLFLGLFHRHCRHIFGIDIKGVSEDMLEDLEVASDEDMDFGRKLILSGEPPLKLKNRLNKLTLQGLYEEFTSRPPPSNMTKIALAQELVNSLSGIIPADTHSSPAPVKPKHNRALDKIVLLQVQDDMSRTILPSWIGRAPPNIGNPGHGKLSADQWRTLCTVHLPITLTRLWTLPDALPNRRKMLENFLDLVTAVLYGTPRQITEKRIKIYDHFIFRYARGLLEVYDDITLVPNQHYALHLGAILRRFGPTHSYWAFPFERYIGLLSDINTNRKLSDMETTFMETYCMGSNLRSLLSTELIPSVVDRFRQVIDIALGSDSRGSLMSDLMVFGAGAEPIGVEFNEKRKVLLPTLYYSALLVLLQGDHTLNAGVQFIDHSRANADAPKVYLNPYCEFLKDITHRGLRFTHSKASSSVGDSYILYKSLSRTPSTNLAMGQIESLFVHRRFSTSTGHFDQIFVVIRRFSALSAHDQAYDPYRGFRHLRMSLVYSTPLETIEVLPISNVIAHFASCPYEEEALSQPCMVVVPLQR